jgi:GT2 family glycosyltransferase
MTGVSLSTVIVAHNSLAELRAALPPLLEELDQDDELIIVDNASADSLVEEIASIAPRARVISLGDNLGFTGGANRGAAAASGDLLVLLNPDAVVQPGWREAIAGQWGGRWAAWMGLVALADGESINTSGGMLHFTGFGWAGQVGQPLEAAPKEPREVAFLSGACLALPRAAWEQTGGFPESFFMYCEDVDLSLRLRLEGGELGVIPAARVIHDYEFAKGPQKWRLLERNRWATVIRTYPAALLLLVTPALLAADAAVWAVSMRGGWVRMKALATLDVVRGAPRLIRERRRIQAGRRVSAAEFASAMVADLDSPYFGRLGRHAAISRALRLYWTAVGALLRLLP